MEDWWPESGIYLVIEKKNLVVKGGTATNILTTSRECQSEEVGYLGHVNGLPGLVECHSPPSRNVKCRLGVQGQPKTRKQMRISKKKPLAEGARKTQ
jgi:hypothetical protein